MELHHGELVGLIGPNGAGKTTLFNLISGVYSPTHGDILFRGESHRATLDWLDETFGRLSTSTYADRRGLWYLAHLAGWLILLIAIAPTAARGASRLSSRFTRCASRYGSETWTVHRPPRSVSGL